MKRFKVFFSVAAMIPIMSIATLAGQWKQDASGWYYQNGDGSYIVEQWYKDNDHWYYFDEQGYMLTNTSTEYGYQLGRDGALIGSEEELIALELFMLINIERKRAGLSELELNAELMKNTQIRAEECALNFDHTRPNGENFASAVTVAYQSVGENLIYSTDFTPQWAVMRWMVSPSHKKNILNPNWTETGLGINISDGKIIAAQLFLEK